MARLSVAMVLNLAFGISQGENEEKLRFSIMCVDL